MSDQRFISSSSGRDPTGEKDLLIEHMNEPRFYGYTVVAVLNYGSWFKVIWEMKK